MSCAGLLTFPFIAVQLWEARNTLSEDNVQQWAFRSDTQGTNLLVLCLSSQCTSLEQCSVLTVFHYSFTATVKSSYGCFHIISLFLGLLWSPNYHAAHWIFFLLFYFCSFPCSPLPKIIYIADHSVQRAVRFNASCWSLLSDSSVHFLSLILHSWNLSWYILYDGRIRYFL